MLTDCRVLFLDDDTTTTLVLSSDKAVIALHEARNKNASLADLTSEHIRDFARAHIYREEWGSTRMMAHELPLGASDPVYSNAIKLAPRNARP
jgi:hypothetical protein